MLLYHIPSHKKALAFRNKNIKSSSIISACIALCCTILPAVLFFCGCNSKAADPISTTDFKLNTVIKVTIYDSQDTSLLDESMAICDKYEKIFSRTLADSELYKLNHRLLPALEEAPDTYLVSEPLAELISEGLHYSELSRGAFDIAIEPLTSLWDFTAENPSVPDDSKILEAVSRCNYKNVSVNQQNITLRTEDTTLELGAVAKGYIADKIKEYLISQNVKSAIINLGGNVLCIGSKPDGTPFKIGIQKPFADRNETIATMDITDKSVVSSGIYERCFEENGTLYHHILNPQTGYPYDNDLVAVTIISDKSVDGDALSTTCFALGLENGLDFAEAQNVQAFFVTKDYEVHYTEGFEDKIAIHETQKAS